MQMHIFHKWEEIEDVIIPIPINDYSPFILKGEIVQIKITQCAKCRKKKAIISGGHSHHHGKAYTIEISASFAKYLLSLQEVICTLKKQIINNVVNKQPNMNIKHIF